MKYFKLCLALFFLFQSAKSIAQTTKYKTKNIIWFTPNGVNKINGLAVGFMASNLEDEKLVINGLNAGAGMGGIIALPYSLANATKSKKNKIKDFLVVDTANTIINGLSISLAGELRVSVNGINIAGGITGAANLYGISISGVSTKSNEFKGISISGISNTSKKRIGLQIALLNNCKDLKGLQIGLWNKSGKRGLPFINWGT